MFQGFSDRTSAFFWDLSFNNERPWFSEHRAEFENNVNAPLKALAGDMAVLLNAAHPEYDWQTHISRIYRDARRLFGRGPFKDNMWAAFYRNGSAKEEPQFYFGISARDYCWGMGWFEAPAAVMELYRRAIDANPARFERIISDIDSSGRFMLGGESYKKQKGSYSGDVARWYNKKSFYLEYIRDFGPEIFDTELPQKLAEDFEALMPLYKWLLELFGNADGPGPEWGVE